MFDKPTFKFGTLKFLCHISINIECGGNILVSKSVLNYLYINSCLTTPAQVQDA